MEKERLTIEEVNEFNPTLDNPMVLVHDTSYFGHFGKTYKLISRVYNERVAVINEENEIDWICMTALGYLPSPKKPKTKMVQFYKAILRDRNSGSIFTPDALLTENLRTAADTDYKDPEYELLGLRPIIEVEMPIDFEE